MAALKENWVVWLGGAVCGVCLLALGRGIRRTRMANGRALALWYWPGYIEKPSAPAFRLRESNSLNRDSDYE